MSLRALLLATGICAACTQPPSAPTAPTDVSPDISPDIYFSTPRCVVPPNAPEYVREAIAAEGYSCERVPIPLRAPRDVIESRDGTIYVTEMSAGRIVRLSNEGAVPVVSGLDAPIGLRELPDGRLLVAEEGAHRVSRVDPRTGARETIADGLAQATYLTLGPDGAAYVSSFTALDTPTATVKRVGLDGAVRDFATGLNVPEGLFFDERGRLHVSNWGAPSRLLRLEPAGGDASTATVLAHGFARLYGAAPHPDGVAVCDTATGTVTLVRGDGTREVILRDVAVPAGISGTAGGALLLTELGRDDFSGLGYVIRLSRR